MHSNIKAASNMHKFVNGFSFSVIHSFLQGWEQESHFLDSGTNTTEIASGAENLLRAHKKLYQAALAVSKATNVSLQQVGWPETQGTVSVSKATLKETRVWLTQNFGIADSSSITVSLLILYIWFQPYINTCNI
jgi:hypothetical protein